MIKRKVQLVLFVFLICSVIFFQGCSTLGLKPWVDRTPDEKALTILQTFNQENKDTLARAKEIEANPVGYTEVEKQVVRTKKAVLVELAPLINIYKNVVLGGGVPDKATEDKIIDLLRKLGRQL